MGKRSIKDIAAGHGFGTAPVFLTSICTILGAIMFLRFGWAVGNLGLLGAIGIVVLGHMITIPTGLAISEIATNLKVGGGGEYYIISRSFGTRIGAAIGIMLYASQVISIAFYVIAFAEGVEFFRPQIERYILSALPIALQYDPRMVSLPLAMILFGIMLTKGAKIGVKLLWFIFAAIAIALISFFAGLYMADAPNAGLTTVASGGNASFMAVFAVCFPAFTGMTAGVGLSGDLKNPGKSIPLGIMSAIVLGLVVYLAIVVTLYYTMDADTLAGNYLAMYDIAIFGPVILVGLFAATLSSAVGSLLIAPRTMQALAKDKIIPQQKVSGFLSEGRRSTNEPTNATLVCCIVAAAFIMLGNLNVVAGIITMFFLITYGSVCLISFLEHFAGNPSYRPTFKTWWIGSLAGAILCFGMMFLMNIFYAFVAIVIMIAIYFLLGITHKQSRSFAVIFQGVMFQLSRYMKIALLKSKSKPDRSNWRPSVIAISTDAVNRTPPKLLLKWISHHYGFGTMIHLIPGKLNKDTVRKGKRVNRRLVEQLVESKANYTVNAMVSPSFTSAIAQAVQISGMSGLDNNSIMFEFYKADQSELNDIKIGCKLAENMGFNLFVLRFTGHNFGYKRAIHIWIRDNDIRNANIMILLAFIIMEHKDWKAEIKIFTAFQESREEARVKEIKDLIEKGRLPISVKNVKSLVYSDQEKLKDMVHNRSSGADLTILGFDPERLDQEGPVIFTEFPELQETLFVSAGEDIELT